jgi:O-antigen/teichoic acid export membrane protein
MQQRSIKFNTAMSFLGAIARMAIPLVTTPYTSRILGPEGSGKIAFAFATTQWFSFAATAGLITYASREIAKVRHDRQNLCKTALEFSIINSISVLTAWLLFLSYYAVSPRLQQEPTLMLVYGCGMLLCLFDCSWFFQGMEDYRYITLRSLTAQILGAIGIFIFIHKPGDYVWVAWLTLITGMLTAMANVRHFWRLLQPLPQVELSPARLLKPLSFTFVWFLLAAIHITADVQIVGWLTNDHTTGLYNAASRLNKMTLALLTCMSGVLMPRISNCLVAGKKEEYQRLGNLSFRFIWTFGLPAVAGIILLAPDLVQTLAGQRFAGAVPTMRLMAPLILIIAMRDFAAGNILYPNHRERWIFGFNLFSAATIPLLGFFLLPKSSLPAQAMAGILLVVETINVLGLLYLASRMFPLDWLSRGNRFAILNTAVMMATVWLLHQKLNCLWGSSDGQHLTLHASIRLAVCATTGMAIYLSLLLVQRDPLIFGPLKPYLRRFRFPGAPSEL